MKKVLVALSGGVDSSAAAALLIEKGYDVSGAVMRLFSEDSETESRAKAVADTLGIPFFVFDFTDIFEREVISPFCEQYKLGKTPNPCVFCNKHLKFGAFFDRADEMGFDYIATGHYAQIESVDGKVRLKCQPRSKDQSYVLYNLNEKILSRLILPVGGMDKADIREYARRAGLSNFDLPDSQEICFIPDDDYVRFLNERGIDSCEGDFVDVTGQKIGTHKGIIHYTVGQRKGLGAFGSPKYVLSLDANNNTVILGENTDLFVTRLVCREVTFLDGRELDCEICAEAKIRYSAPPVRAKILPLGDGRAEVLFDSPVRAVTPGQSVVFYDGEYLLGGGVIE